MFRLYFMLFLPLCPLGLGAVKPFPQENPMPVLFTSAIIEIYDKDENMEGIVLIERGNAPIRKALPGGKVEYGESVEHAVRREMKKMTQLDLHELRQFHVYSEPGRDPSRHAVDIAFLAKAYNKPQASDDVNTVIVVPIEAITWDDLAFDHAQILKDYLSYREGNKDILMIKT
jgi:8-oxo-dGTP diphosphatase